MANELKLRRGTAAEHAAFTGGEGETTADTTNNRLVLHDGTTPGGHPHATEAYVDGAIAAYVDDAISAVNLGHGQCRLAYVSATQIKLSTFNGDKIQIAGTVYHIPSSGVTAANTSVDIDGASGNLAANTVYNVFLFNNSGALTLSFSTAARSADSTAGNVGVQIKSGDNTRTLVGKVETNASSQFASNMVISWFNRRVLRVGATDGSDRNASTIWTEIVSTIRARYLSWGSDEGAIRISYRANLKHATVGTAMYIGAGLDGVSSVIGGQSVSAPVANYYCALSNSESVSIAEGAHYATLVGGAGSGSAVFAGTNIPSSLEVAYWG